MGLPQSRISELDVGGNGDVGDAGAAPVLSALWGHPTLARLNLGGVGLTAKSAMAVQALLKPKPGASKKPAGGGKAGACPLEDIVVAGNEELPEEVVQAVAAWKTRQWAVATSLMA